MGIFACLSVFFSFFSFPGSDFRKNLPVVTKYEYVVKVYVFYILKIIVVSCAVEMSHGRPTLISADKALVCFSRLRTEYMTSYNVISADLIGRESPVLGSRSRDLMS